MPTITITTPERGALLYRSWNGSMEIVRFIEESIAEGASVPTWVVRSTEGAGRVRCSRGMYLPTAREAWQSYLKQLEDSIPGMELYRQEVEKNITAAKSEAERVRALLG